MKDNEELNLFPFIFFHFYFVGGILFFSIQNLIVFELVDSNISH